MSLPTTPSEALSQFVRAQIGGEAIGSPATSELMLQTATKAISSAGSLVDSPALGVAPLKPVTKLIRGGSVAVHLLSDTLAGNGLKRGFGLLILTLGAALTAIALISGSAPAWLASTGFAILIGGLAYTALVSGQLALTLVLATPVIPLLVWSRAQQMESATPQPSRTIQIVLISALVLTALVMGSVRTPEGAPPLAASKAFGGWALAHLRFFGVLVVLATLTLAVWFGPGEKIRSWLSNLALPRLAWVGLTILAVASLIVVVNTQHRAAAVAAAPHPPEGWGPVRIAKGLRRTASAGWAWTFGLVYLVLGWLVANQPSWAAQVVDWNGDEAVRSLPPWFAVLGAFCFFAALWLSRPLEPTGSSAEAGLSS